jgi:hypothetical protein
MPTIPSQHRLSIQILTHWWSFRDLKLMFPVSRHAEQLCLPSQQHEVATVEDSELCTEIENLKSQEDDPRRVSYGSSR